MKMNVGTIDRGLRAVLGLVLLIVAFAAGLSPVAAAVAGLVGLILLGTAAIKFCPLYRIFGLSTCKQ